MRLMGKQVDPLNLKDLFLASTPLHPLTKADFGWRINKMVYQVKGFGFDG